jgi:hypothetical protein
MATVPDRVEIVETNFTPDLPKDRARRLLQLLFCDREQTQSERKQGEGDGLDEPQEGAAS